LPKKHWFHPIENKSHNLNRPVEPAGLQTMTATLIIRVIYPLQNGRIILRIDAEPKRNIQIYLDSGWPEDNYEVTRSMRDLLLERGYEFGKDLLYFAFPEALHSETYWATRSHIPFQFFFGNMPSFPEQR
jgi:hypothetical protein